MTNGAGTALISDKMNFSESVVSEYLKNRYIFLSEVDSTNEFCKSDSVEKDCIVRAMRQSRGRGRMGRKFFSDDGGFYISYCFFPENLRAEELLPLTGLCAVAVLQAIESAAGICPSIKWTNDLILSGKKICGILAESVLGDGGKVERVIIGIGINTNQNAKCFEGELSDIASSILALTGKGVDEDALLFALTGEMLSVYSVLCGKSGEKQQYIDFYRSHCETLGKNIKILKPSVAQGKDPREIYLEKPEIFPLAVAVDIDDCFGLIVRYPDMKEETISFGEVSIR